MEQIVELLTFTESLVPAERLAQQFSREQLNPTKAHQVRLNTLAVYAANYYLTCIGVQTDLAASGSWDALTRMVWDAADLVLPNLGKLECRSLLPGDTTVTIPLEVWDDRIGCLVVKIDEEQRQSEILGFVRNATVEAVPLNQMESLESLIDYICDLEEAVVRPIAHLRSWIQGVVTVGWTILEESLLAPPPELSFEFRHPKTLAPKTLALVRASKRLDFQLAGAEESIELVIGLKPNSAEEFGVSVALYPIDDQLYLPGNLQLAILDETGKTVTSSQAGHGQSLEFQFDGVLGEEFSVKVSLGEISVTEAFCI